MDLGRISLRAKERGFLAGGTDTGKSTLAEALIVDFVHRYRRSHVLILDSKPRFRADLEVSGRRARARYSRWDHGATVPGAVVVTDPAHLEVAWATGAQICIAQADTGADVPALVACLRAFFEDSRAGRPSLVMVDETMDFFRSNGSPIGGDDAVVRSARAGRERGLAGLYCSQRTRGIPAQLMEEMTKLYLLRIDYRADLKRLQEMGAPPAIMSKMPTVKHRFIYWTKADYARVWGPYQLTLSTRRAESAG
ncbi:MAG TPA: hypothetical protein VGH66_01430 [Acidimicrobiales bacterium]